MAIRDILLIGIYTGMRRGEIVSLRREQVDMERRILRVEEIKTGEPLELPITRQFSAIFDLLLADVAESFRSGGAGLDATDIS